MHAIRRAFPTVLILFFPPVLAGILTHGGCKPTNHGQGRAIGSNIVADAFPPDGPGGLAAIVCLKCGGHFRYDPSVPVKRSLQHPDYSF